MLRDGHSPPGAAEWRALVALTGPDPQAPTGPVDWNRLIDIALRHKVLLLLSHGIERTGVEVQPVEVRDRLQQTVRHRLMRSLLLARETAQVAKAFQRAEIPLIVLKGLPLAQAVYGGINLRDPGDIDILIPPDRLPEATALLVSQGYEMPYAPLVATPRRRERLTRLHKDLGFVHPRKAIAIECHWRLSSGHSGMPMDPDWMHRQSTARIGDAAITVLPSAENFVYLCAHGCNHYWNWLKWLNDIRWTLHDPRLISGDWESVEAAAERAGMARVVVASALLVQRLDGVSLPAPLAAEDPAADRDSRAFAHYLHRTGGETTDPQLGPLRSCAHAFRKMRSSGRGDASLLALCRQFWKPTLPDMMAVDLPDRMEWAYIPLRIVRILWRETVGRVLDRVSRQRGG